MSFFPSLIQHSSALAEIACCNEVSNVRLVGSVARGDDTPKSDVDLLVHFDPSIAAGMAIGAFQYQASDLLG